MAIRYRVAARVVDARSDQPRATDCWFVDTNVLFWASYANASYAPSGPKLYQQRDYEAYLKKVTQAGGKLFWCGLSLAEIAHRIEATEFAIAKHAGATAAANPKEYRHNDPKEWARIVSEVDAAWSIVTTLAQPVVPGLVVDAATTAAAASELHKCGIGGYDIFLLQVLRSEQITGLISDDGDFCTVHKLMLCTANASVLGAASSQSRILRR